MATSRTERDPASDLKGALTPLKGGHHAAITDPKKLAGLLRSIDEYQVSFVVKSALQFLPMLFCSQGELQQAELSEIDLEAAG